MVHFPHLSGRVSFRVSILLALTVLSSCASGKNVQNATKGVEQFHSQINTEQYQTIYLAADEGFHKATK